MYKKGVLNMGTSDLYKFVQKEKLFELEGGKAHEKIIEFILEKSKK